MLREITVSLNKEVVAGHLLAIGCRAPLFFLAGRGGEEEGRWGANHPGTSIPPAGRGGEESRTSPWVALAFSGGFALQRRGWFVRSSGGDMSLPPFPFQAIEVMAFG
jgi:hypothetical protein